MFDHPPTSRLWLFIDHISRPWVLAVLMAAYLLFHLLIFPFAAGDFDNVPLDLMFAYSPEQAYAQLASYGEQGRASYAWSTAVLDLAYAVVYTLLFAVWLSLLLRGRSRHCSYLSMLPFCIFVFDIIENSGILLMLANYPDEIYWLALGTSVATTIKWLIAVPVALLALGLSLWRGLQFLTFRGTTIKAEK